MNDDSGSKPALWLRIAQFPVTRLLLVGGIVFALIAFNNGFRTKLASSPALATAVTAGMAAVALGVYLCVARYLERRSVPELALPRMGREFGVGALIGVGLYSLAVLALMMLGMYRIDGLNPWTYLLPAIPMALSSGFFEELLFRGVLFRIVEESLGSWIALAVSSLLFGFVHLLNPAGTVLVTDESPSYFAIGQEMVGHHTVNHKAKQYVDPNGYTTNSAEGFFSQVKRSIDGTHHHVSVEHLNRYLGEFDFRYTTRKMSDGERTAELAGKMTCRLSYRPLTGRAA